MKRNPLSRRARVAYTVKIMLWTACWGFPIGLVGCVICMSIVGIPIGFPLIVLAAWPLARMVEKRGKEVRQWRMSPTPGLTVQDLDEILWEDELTDEPWNEQHGT